MKSLLPHCGVQLKSRAAVSAIPGYTAHFYGDKLKIRRRMVDAIRMKREKLGYTRSRLDRICFFGFFLPRAQKRIPTCAEFEDDPRLMNGFIFSLASGPLELAIDRVLGINRRINDRMSLEMRKSILHDMRKNGWGVVGTKGGEVNVSRIPVEKQIVLYVLFKILDELN